MVKDFIANKILLNDKLINFIKKILLYDKKQVLSKIIEDDIIYRAALNNNYFVSKAIEDDKFKSLNDFLNYWKLFRNIVAEDRDKYFNLKIVINRLAKKSKIKDILLDLMCERNKVFLYKGVLKYPDRASLWILINEILINEDYFFKTNTDTPKILDCGTHFGLALYYFKSIYPNARIIGFEPILKLREMAIDNIKENGYFDVEVLPYALSDENKVASFIVSKTDSMAGSLTERRRIAGDEVFEIKVQCRKISGFLKEPIHFLKLDIEGSEDLVLEESKEFLSNVQHIFCEYHHGNGLEADRLGNILTLLDESGFDVQIGKSFYFQHHTNRRPMVFVDKPYSVSIWAKNRNWKY